MMTTVTTRIHRQYSQTKFSAEIAGGYNHRSWTTPDMPHWCLGSQEPLVWDNEYVGAGTAGQDLLDALEPLFAAHLQSLAHLDGCNIECDCMDHEVELPDRLLLSDAAI